MIDIKLSGWNRLLSIATTRKNTYRRYSEENEKGIKACYYKGRWQKKNEGQHNCIRHKIINKMTIGIPSLSVITLSVSGLLSIKKTHNGWMDKNTRSDYLLSTTDLL